MWALNASLTAALSVEPWPLRRDPNQAMNGRAWAGSWWPSSVRWRQREIRSPNTGASDRSPWACSSWFWLEPLADGGAAAANALGPDCHGRSGPAQDQV